MTIQSVKNPKILNTIGVTNNIQKISILEVAEKIKNSRNKRAPLIKSTEKSGFRYTKKDGSVHEAIPSEHAIEQFTWRYWIINPCFIKDNPNEVKATMETVFNSCRRISGNSYMHRNKMRKDGVSAMVWGNKNICFLIDNTTNMILTVELNGKYRGLNGKKFKDLVNSNEFDHSRYQKQPV